MHDVHLKKLDGLGNLVKPGERYYIQDHSPPWADCARWWRPQRAGYTIVLDEAGIYDGDEVVQMRPTDIPWPANVARVIAQRHVDRDALLTFAARYKNGSVGGAIYGGK